MFSDNRKCFLSGFILLIGVVISTNALAEDQNIESGDCNVQIQGSNNAIIYSGCKGVTEAQKLQKILEEVLREVRVSLIREEEMVFPALETFLTNPTEYNWRRVTWAANESIRQIRTGIEKSLQYDAEMENSSVEAISLVAKANREANRPYINSKPNRPYININPLVSIRQDWNQRAFTKSQFEKVRMPTKEQALKWKSNLQEIYVSLENELTTILHQLAMANTNSE